MDLLDLFQTVPSVLEACINGETANFRALRAVSKTASLITRGAFLKSYCVSLQGAFFNNRRTGGHASKLLRYTRIGKLDVVLGSSSCFSFASDLTAFLQGMGNALESVRSMSLYYETSLDAGASTLAADSAAFVALLQACPGLASLILRTSISQALLLRLSQAIPQLTELDLQGVNEKLARSMLLCQPPTFPNLTSILLPRFKDGDMPDISRETGIRDLTLDVCELELNTSMRLLPPNLQHLCCSSVLSDQAASALTFEPPVLLSSLLSLEIHDGSIHLSALAQLLRSAPLLTSVVHLIHPRTNPGMVFITIKCTANESTAADLALVQQRLGPEFVKAAQVCFYSSAPAQSPFEEDPETELAIFTSRVWATLPTLSGVSRCVLDRFYDTEEVKQVLSLVPDVQHLTLSQCFDMDDETLQELAICENMTSLRCIPCHSIKRAGLQDLCLEMPNLESIECNTCERLFGRFVTRCARVLNKLDPPVRLDCYSLDERDQSPDYEDVELDSDEEDVPDSEDGDCVVHRCYTAGQILFLGS